MSDGYYVMVSTGPKDAGYKAGPFETEAIAEEMAMRIGHKIASVMPEGRVVKPD